MSGYIEIVLFSPTDPGTPYYDYNGDQLNTYALEIVRINSIIVFIWHIIYAQAIQNNINIDYPFYIQFYL